MEQFYSTLSTRDWMCPWQFSLIEQVAALHSLGSMSAIWNFLDESLELVAQSLKVECLEKGAGCNKVDNQHATVFKITCFFQSA